MSDIVERALGLVEAQHISQRAGWRGNAIETLVAAAGEIDRLRAEAASLRTVMVAAAEEIAAHWDAHCDAEGYGPANLQRRLEDGIPSEYGYTAGAFAKLKAENDRLRAALSAQPAAPQWQPIETAPTDGTEFLAHKPSIGLFAARILDGDHPDCEYDGGVHCAWDHGYVEDVTHWMPLPAAPQAPQPGAQEGA